MLGGRGRALDLRVMREPEGSVGLPRSGTGHFRLFHLGPGADWGLCCGVAVGVSLLCVEGSGSCSLTGTQYFS